MALDNYSQQTQGRIGESLQKFARLQPDKIAIYYEDQTITYKEFTHHVSIYQHSLRQKADSKKSQKVALLISNEPAFLEIYFAIIMLGWTVIPFDPKWTTAEADYIKKVSEPSLIITNKTFTQTAAYNFSDAYYLDDIHVDALSKTEISVVRTTEPFYLGFTSGSTGLPKGFIRNQQSWINSFHAGEAIFHYGSKDIIMAPGPLNHSLSLFGATHALHIGASFCLTPSFSAPKVLKWIDSGVVSVIYGVPTMLHSLAALNKPCTKRIKFLSSGAKLDQVVYQSVQAVFPNATIYEYFGASELSYVTYATDLLNERYPDSVGMPFPSVKITIRDQSGKELPNNQIGDIYIESDFLFSGYVQNELATKETLTKYGAFIGDVGYLNEIGALTVVGRKNHMIITGGQNVYPEEVEKVIKMVGAVKDAIIIGVDDIHWGERIIAFIEWIDSNDPNVDQVKARCKERLSIYKRPRKYVSVTKFPYTHTGKIARHDIKANIKRWIE